MNPRGRQYALGGTLQGWTRLAAPTDRQQRLLSLAYRGLSPLTYGRYGSRQWTAPFRRTRVVVKDPFALLSTAAIHRITGAVPVLVYRHPAAVLSSYRRMGWVPDVDELNGVYALATAEGLVLPPLSLSRSAPLASSMATFWAMLHEIALADIAEIGEALVVSHSELASSGVDAGRTLFHQLGLGWSLQAAAMLSKTGSGVADPARLHNLDRSPAEVASAWRSKIAPEDVEAIETIAGPTHARLERLRLPFDPIAMRR